MLWHYNSNYIKTRSLLEYIISGLVFAVQEKNLINCEEVKKSFRNELEYWEVLSHALKDFQGFRNSLWLVFLRADLSRNG